MQPLAIDVRQMRHLAVSGASGEDGDAIAEYRDMGLRALYFFPAPQTASLEEMGVSASESRMTVKAPWTKEFRPGDRLADEDGKMLWEVLSVTDYPGHQTMEVRPL